MIRFNFFLQSVFCGLAVLLGMAQLAFGESVYWLLILALPLGVTQFLASIQLAASAQHRSKPGLVHTTVSTLYLVTVMFWGRQCSRTDHCHSGVSGCVVLVCFISSLQTNPIMKKIIIYQVTIGK